MSKHSLTCGLSGSLFFIHVCPHLPNIGNQICKDEAGTEYVIKARSIMTDNYDAAKAACVAKNMILLAPRLSYCATNRYTSPYKADNAWLNAEGRPDQRTVSNRGWGVYPDPGKNYHVICYGGKFIGQ